MEGLESLTPTYSCEPVASGKQPPPPALSETRRFTFVWSHMWPRSGSATSRSTSDDPGRMHTQSEMRALSYKTHASFLLDIQTAVTDACAVDAEIGAFTSFFMYAGCGQRLRKRPCAILFAPVQPYRYARPLPPTPSPCPRPASSRCRSARPNRSPSRRRADPPPRVGHGLHSAQECAGKDDHALDSLPRFPRTFFFPAV